MKQIGLVLGLLVAGCLPPPPSISTLPQRRQYLAQQINDSLTATLKCPNANLTFVSQATPGACPLFPQYFDFYVAERLRAALHRFHDRRENARIDHRGAAGVASSVGRAVPRWSAHADRQDRRVRFRLQKDDVTYVDLSEQLATLRNSYGAAIGAAGCGKRATYHTHCNQNGYSAGANQIACSSKQDITTATD